MNDDRMKTLFASLLVAFGVSAARAEDWPRFRGPSGQGISSETGIPLTWSKTDNIAWKTSIDGEGWSSPVVAGDHVFVTSTTDDGRSCHVIAVDRLSGRILWNTKVFDQQISKQ